MAIRNAPDIERQDGRDITERNEIEILHQRRARSSKGVVGGTKMRDRRDVGVRGNQ